MPVEISTDTHPDVLPLAFLIGHWAGAGVGDYPTIEGFRFGQEVVFTAPPGKPFLEYVSRSWLLDEDGTTGRALATESGYWRPQPDGGLEVVIAHPTGIAEIWVGEIDGAKAELRTDVVARTTTAKDYGAGHRLYGLVKGELMWVFEMAAMGEPMQPHLSAQLKRMPSTGDAS
jgi:hypothetical protein